MPPIRNATMETPDDEDADLGTGPEWCEAETIDPAIAEPNEGVPPGTQIDHYIVRRRVGEGGMGIVYEATDTVEQRQVAIKLLRRAFIGGEALARFQREHNTLARIDHPKIVRYLDHGTYEGCAYLVTEWLSGQDLSTRLEFGPLSLEEACTVVRGIAEALSHAHQLGIVHRDVKPQNIFLSGGRLDDIRLLDFGIARLVHSDERLTGTGAMIGTPGYMSPEQIRATTTLNARTDIFALGCVLFECVTGLQCFTGLHAVAVAAKVLHEEVPLAKHLPAHASPQLNALLHAMLAKDPWDRPANGAAVLSALERLAHEQAVPSSPATPAIKPSGERFVSMILLRSREQHPTVAAAVLNTELRSLGARQLPISSGVSLIELKPKQHGDQPIRAAHCALHLRSAMRHCALVIVSGRANVAGGAWVGEVIDNGLAVLRATPDGTIALDSLTASMLGDRFEVHSSNHASTLIRARSFASVRRELLGQPTPCVGRTKEMGLLSSTWLETCEEAVANAVVVVGASGIGKSRLRYELVSRLQNDDATIILARDEPLTMDARYGTLRRLLLSACRISEADDRALAATKLIARIRRCFPDARPAGKLTRLLAELAGMSLENAPPTSGSADELLDAWLSWLRAECEQRPVVLVLEDLHWSDAKSVAFIDATLAALEEQPLMVIALARPELDSRHPSVWHARRTQRIDLRPLRMRVCVRLARAVLGDDYDQETVDRLAERSGGNAFFLEELIRAAADGKLNEVPDSVHGLLQARLEKLSELDRRVLQAASIIGPSFWRGAIASLLQLPAGDVSLARAIDKLTTAELIHQEPISSIPGESELRFRHALVRESVYATIDEKQRCSAHLAAAEWKQTCGIIDPRLLVRHYVAQADPEIATAWLERLCDHTWYARSCPGFEEIVTRIKAFLETSGSPAQRARAQLALAIGWGCLNRFQNSYDALTRARQLDIDPSAAWRVEVRVAARQFDLLRAAKAIEQWHALGNVENDDPALLYSMATTFTNLGKLDEAKAVLAKYERCASNSARSRLQALKIRAFIAITERNFAGSLEPYRALVELARKHDLAVERGNALHNVSESLARIGDYQGALEMLDASDRVAVALGYERLVSMNAALRLWLRFRYEGDDVQEQLRAAVATAEEERRRWDAASAQRLLCDVLKAQGKHDEALQIARELLARAQQYHYKLLIDDATELLETLA